MAKPYSEDFRQKVMHAIEVDGLPKSAVSRLFHISRNTINLWCQRKAETGDVKAKVSTGGQSQRKIQDLAKFAEFVNQHPDKTQRELAQLWDGGVSQPTISRAIAKIRYRRKKTYGHLQRDEAQRAAFLGELGDPRGCL
ncbi:MAG: hypothetical protein HC918_12585 [Oscillatoriales cyanobacterium SM2_1_8]|nr:hypothetical protein [Oscillatoriales cyanobacterium SM2_1_8]